MREIDETDLSILRLLVEDARRPYSDIADRVDVSAPTVSDRIDRLQEIGVIDQFTVDIDRSTFTEGLEVFVEVTLSPNADDRVADRLASVEQVEHVFMTSDMRLFTTMVVPEDSVRSVLSEAVDLDIVDSYRVHLLEQDAWEPTIGDAELSLSCDECSNTVTSEGTSTRIDGELYHFCCPTCQSNFEERYTSLAESA